MQNEQKRSVRVQVIELPPPAKVPFLSDSSKLISVLAFVVSIVTTSYTLWQTRQQAVEATLKEITLLLDDAAKAEKAVIRVAGRPGSTSDSLQSNKLKSDVYLAYKKAFKIRSSLDTPQWLTIAAYISNFGDFAKALKAVEQAEKNADSPPDKEFAYATEAQINEHKGDLNAAQDSLAKATDALSAESETERGLQYDEDMAKIQILWLQLVPPANELALSVDECKYLIDHFSSASDALDDSTGDAHGHKEIMAMIDEERRQLDPFKAAFDGCKKSQATPNTTPAAPASSAPVAAPTTVPSTSAPPSTNK